LLGGVLDDFLGKGHHLMHGCHVLVRGACQILCLLWWLCVGAVRGCLGPW
jgi:hypothetical protein